MGECPLGLVDTHVGVAVAIDESLPCIGDFARVDKTQLVGREPWCMLCLMDPSFVLYLRVIGIYFFCLGSRAKIIFQDAF